MSDDNSDTSDTWKNSPFAPAGEQRELSKDFGDLPTEAKVDRLAETTMRTVERVEAIAAQVEQMAAASGASQQADTERTGSKRALWGEDSPFALEEDR